MPNKKQFFRSFGLDGGEDGINVDNLFNREAIVNYYMNKYFNLFMSSYDIKGDALTTTSRYYLMKQFWFKGTVATWRIKHTDLLGFAPYAVST